MKYFKQFIIQYAGLNTGIHQYEYDIDEKFFEQFEVCDIKKCDVKLVLDFYKQERMIILIFRMSGTIEVTCDRCLEKFNYPVECNETVTLRFSDSVINLGDEIEEIPATQQELDIRQYIFDFLNLQLPFRKVHPANEADENVCNKKVITILNNYSKNENTDPRWDMLKDLKYN